MDPGQASSGSGWALRSGLYTAHALRKHHQILSPTLILSREDADFVVETLRESIEAATESLKVDGYLPR